MQPLAHLFTNLADCVVQFSDQRSLAVYDSFSDVVKSREKFLQMRLASNLSQGLSWALRQPGL